MKPLMPHNSRPSSTLESSRQEDFLFIQGPEAPSPEDKITALSTILRFIGAGVFLAAASVFLVHHWDSGNHIQRYFLLLAYTLILSGAGIFCGLKIRENKGARTFLSLSLAVMPVHFGVLGALLYSRFALDTSAVHAHALTTWIAPTPASALLTLIGALAVLAPLCRLGFQTLGRSRAGLLTGAFLASNALLLLPVRSPSLIALLIPATAAALCRIEMRLLRQESSLQTLEGRFARLMLWSGPLLLGARTLFLYHPTDLFAFSLWSCLALTLFLPAPGLVAAPEIQKNLQRTAATAATLACARIPGMFGLGDFLSSGYLPAFGLPLSAALILMSCYALGSGAEYRRLGVIAAIGSVGLNLLLHPGLISSFICLLVALGTLVHGYFSEQKFIFLAGAAGMILGLACNLKYAVRLYSLGSWGGLALLGILIVLAASVLEKHSGRLLRKAGELKERFSRWDY